MLQTRRRILVPVILLCSVSFCVAQLTPQRLLVVYNENFPGSEELAREYAKLRSVPSNLVVGIKCATTEVITRDEFIDTIREPIDAHLTRLNLVERAKTIAAIMGVTRNLIITLRSEIDGILLSYGVPLTISHDPAVLDETQPAQMQNTTAAVDSELATMLTFGLNPTGGLPNPFFKSETRFKHPDQPTLLMLLVARLDGPDIDTARLRMRQAIEAEKSGGLRGLGLFDARGLTNTGLKIGDEWIVNSSRLYRRAGFKVRLDEFPEQFSASSNYQNVTFYLGWYSQNVEGIFANPEFNLATGAVAYHIHSFSAQSLRTSTAYWAGPLIAKGAAATMGSVAEPYLGMTPHLDIFTDRLLRGWTFAEAAYAAQPALSWMITVVGDPLYVPFPSAPLSTKQKTDTGKKSDKEKAAPNKQNKQKSAPPTPTPPRPVQRQS
jgi:uncharacterized protein (TIGR03790 family)